MKLDDALSGVTQLGFDTAPIIYFIEANPTYDSLVTAIFRRVDNGSILGVTSTISVTEVLVQPFMRGDTALAQQYRDLLLNSRSFRLLNIDDVLAERAANLRARYRVRTPDALQLAAAIIAGADAFLTNDRNLERVTDLRVLILDDLEL